VKLQYKTEPTGRVGLVWLLCAAATSIGWHSTAVAQVADAGDAPAILATASADNACTSIARAPWPTQGVMRRAQLQRMEAARLQCLSNAEFLATLGGLWLEEQEPSLAMIWLERSLMLEPGNLGAQADMALALAALGEPEALSALKVAWATRTDVPARLRERVAQALSVREATQLPFAKLGRLSNGSWASHREASVMVGYETNLDHSPKLSELTLTVPGGPIDLELTSPLEPRPGAALLSDVSWQLANSPSPGRIVRAGARLGARASQAQSQTDWQHAQLAMSLSQQWGVWRGQAEMGGVWVTGALNEPYRLARMSLTGERDALGCVVRLSLDNEARRQSLTTLADSRTTSALLSTQCPLGGRRAWTWGFAARGGVDKPDSPLRSGGAQRSASLGVRLSGVMGAGMRFDLSARRSHVLDDEGYSPLLENDARRSSKQTQVSLDLSGPLRSPLPILMAPEIVVQLHAVQQQSNIAVFRYKAVSVYSGLRWTW
jgi:hypothetical protein